MLNLSSRVWIAIIYSFTVILLTYFYILKREHDRILQIVRKYNSPINKITVTFYSTRLEDKQHLFIRAFSPDYVVLHEIAHSLCNDIGHTQNFMEILYSLHSSPVHSCNILN